MTTQKGRELHNIYQKAEELRWKIQYEKGDMWTHKKVHEDKRDQFGEKKIFSFPPPAPSQMWIKCNSA